MLYACSSPTKDWHGNGGFDAGADAARMSNPCAVDGGCPAGVWRNITPPSIDPKQFPCTDLQFAPGEPSVLVAMFGDGGGLWKSSDAGATWAQIGNLPMPNSLGRLLIDPKDAKHMYATGSVRGASLGFWVSHDGGTTWAIPGAFMSGESTMWNFDVYNIVADPTDFNHILLTFHNGWPCCGNSAGILESHDGGDSYLVHPPAAGMDHAQGIAFLFNPALGIGDANTWLVGAGYNAGLFRTTDAGATWTQVNPLQQDHGGFDAHYSAQGYLYIGAVGGVYRSTDNGASWEQENNGLPASYYYSVIGDGHYLYTGQSFVGLDYNTPMFVSLEGGSAEGRSWTAYSSQIIPQGPFKMVFDRTNHVIYNATWGSGAWALTVAP
jgi:hypothetical protein